MEKKISFKPGKWYRWDNLNSPSCFLYEAQHEPQCHNNSIWYFSNEEIKDPNHQRLQKMTVVCCDDHKNHRLINISPGITHVHEECLDCGGKLNLWKYCDKQDKHDGHCLSCIVKKIGIDEAYQRGLIP